MNSTQTTGRHIIWSDMNLDLNDATENQIENLKHKLYEGRAARADITRITKRLGDEIAAVYGFNIPKQRMSKEQAR